MAMNTIPSIDEDGLKKFGLGAAVIVAVVFGLVPPFLFQREHSYWPWVLSGLISVCALYFPRILGPVYHAWMRFGLAIGWVTNRVVLFVVFYGVFAMVGSVMRMCGRDAMNRRITTKVTSYRICRVPGRVRDMRRPF